MKQVKIDQLFKIFQKNNPNPTTELNYVNTFQLLIAVMLSAQATDISVNRVTPALFKLAPTPAAMRKLGVPKIKKLIQTIGLFNTKAENIYKTCQQLESLAKIPQTRAELEKLPGVGAKTAAVVLNVSQQADLIPVDTHVFRVSNRLGLVITKTPLKTEKALVKIVPKWALSKAHHWLILHGRYICKARKPLCQKCPLVKLCEYKNKIFVF